MSKTYYSKYWTCVDWSHPPLWQHQMYEQVVFSFAFHGHVLEEAEKCFTAKHPLHVFISCLSVCGLGWDFPCDSERLCCRGKGVTARRDGHTGCLLGLVCVCWHSNCQAATAEAWWRTAAATWFMDSEGGRAEQKKLKKFGIGVEKNQRGSICWICKDSGWPQLLQLPPTMH